MANNATAIGYIKCGKLEEREQLLQVIKQLPNKPYSSRFGIWQGIFHAPLDPAIHGYMITFGLSHKYFGEWDEIGEFLDVWETLIAQMPAYELFMMVEQEGTWSDHYFGNFYFKWHRKAHPELKYSWGDWAFRGMMPIDEQWRSRFAVKLDETLP